MASKKDIEQKAAEIEKIFQQFVTRLSELKKQQSDIIDTFIKELERRKIEELRKRLKDLS